MSRVVRKTGLLLAVAAVAAVAAFGFWYAGRGTLDTVSVPVSRLETVDFIRFERPDADPLTLRKDLSTGRWTAECGKTSFEADASQVETFLHVLNLWEVAYVPDDSARQAWRDAWPVCASRLLLRSGGKTVWRLSYCGSNEERNDGVREFVIRIRRQFYPMTSSWQPSTWKDFFGEDLQVWRNRMIMNWDYDQIAAVEIEDGGMEECGSGRSYRIALESDGEYYLKGLGKGGEMLDRRKVQAYLSCYRQVYFDPLEPARRDASVGNFLYRLTVVPVQGDPKRMDIFQKRNETGEPDLFKAVVLLRSSDRVDTVELSYVVVDKMIKTVDWFREP